MAADDVASPFPIAVLLSPEAQDAMCRYAVEAYQRRGTEWGGLLWGQLFAHPRGGVVPAIVYATNGACDATPTRCDILPQSWELGRQELATRGQHHLINLGDFHSHPKLGVFMSHDDIRSIWSYADVPHWLSLVLDPWSEDFGTFARCGAREVCRVPTWGLDEGVARALGVPAPLMTAVGAF